MYKLCNVKLHVSAYCGHHQVSFTYSPVWGGYTYVGFIDVMHEISYIYKIMVSGIRSVGGLVNMGLGSGCDLYKGLLPPLWLFLLSGIVSPYVLPYTGYKCCTPALGYLDHN